MRRSSLLGPLLALLILGCAGRTPEPAPEVVPTLETGATIGPVEVALDRGSVSANGIDAAERYGIADSGADTISVSVAVKRGEEVVRSYVTDTSTVLGGIAYASPTQRSSRLVKTIAERVVAGL